jgi:hypothetical protein
MTERQKQICEKLTELYEKQMPFVQPTSADAPAVWDWSELDAWAKRREEIRELEEELLQSIRAK